MVLTRNVPPIIQRGLPGSVPIDEPRLRSKIPPMHSFWAIRPRFMSSVEMGQVRPPKDMVTLMTV